MEKLITLLAITMLLCANILLAGEKAAEAFESSGLGLSKEVWETKYGTSSKCPPIFSQINCYATNIGLTFWEKGNNAKSLTKVWDKKGVTLKESKEFSKTLIPADSKLVKTSKSLSGSEVDLYMSESLKSRFVTYQSDNWTFDPWKGGEPGNFIVIHSGSGQGTVSRTLIATGNNP